MSVKSVLSLQPFRQLIRVFFFKGLFLRLHVVSPCLWSGGKLPVRLTSDVKREHVKQF